MLYKPHYILAIYTYIHTYSLIIHGLGFPAQIMTTQKRNKNKIMEQITTCVRVKNAKEDSTKYSVEHNAHLAIVSDVFI